MTVDRKMQAEKKLKPGQGWLQSRDAHFIKTKHDPHFRGAMVIDRDCKRGTRLWLSAWMYTNHKGTVIYFLTASAAEVRKARIAAAKREQARLNEARRKFDERRAKALAAPKILKRGDVI